MNAVCYEICLEGVLSSYREQWFEGMKISICDEMTVLVGPVADQSALHGLLERILDLGIPLISVNRMTGEEKNLTRC